MDDKPDSCNQDIVLLSVGVLMNVDLVILLMKEHLCRELSQFHSISFRLLVMIEAIHIIQQCDLLLRQ